MQVQRTNDLWYWAEYSTFSISDEVGQYRLTVTGYSGDAGDAMNSVAPANGMMFSTPDVDNDVRPDANCAFGRRQGWWLHWCGTSSIGVDAVGSWTTHVGHAGSYVQDVQASRMLVKVD